MSFAAHWELQPEETGRPRAARRKLRLEATGAIRSHHEARVTVHNISTTGLLIESAVGLDVGEFLDIELPHAGTTHANVVWSQNGFFGCQFSSPITGAAISAAQLQAGAPMPVQAARPPVEASGEPFGMRLQRLRKERGMTLMQLADAVGVSKPTVWAWEQERSRPTRDRYDAIAQALGIEVAQLLPERDDRALREMLGRFKQQIAQAIGTTPDKVRILLEL